MSDGPVLFLSRAIIRANWSAIQGDRYNSRPDLLTPAEFIAAVERGEVVIGGARIILQDELLKTER